MQLTVKHFKSEQYFLICDDYDNVVKRMDYEETYELAAHIRINAYLAGFYDGWEKARHSIGNCVVTGAVLDVDAMNRGSRFKKTEA